MKWISCHAYYYDREGWDQLLTSIVRPLFEELSADHLTDIQFFVRYCDPAPHLRIRLRTMLRLQTSVSQVVARRVGDYLATCPSSDVGIVFAPGIETVPDNTIIFQDYEPETERYGGRQALEVAERFFGFCSAKVLDALGRVVESDDRANTRLGLALQMADGLARSAGFTRLEMAGFYAHWLRHVYLRAVPKLDWESYYRANRVGLMRLVDRTWTDIDSTADGSLLRAWQEGCLDMSQEVATLLCGAAAPRDGLTFVGSESKKYFMVIQSQMHMMFNRLGVSPSVERVCLEILGKVHAELGEAGAA